jgi:calcium-translocating P-type ATPase
VSHPSLTDVSRPEGTLTPPAPDPRESLQALFRDLRARPGGLSEEEARRRLVQYGPNLLSRRGGATWPRALARQVIHPLALLLWGAAALAWASGTEVLAVAIVAVIVLNAALAFWQEQQAERSVEALSAYLPEHARVVRGGRVQEIDAGELVIGDIVLVQEGAKVPADARLIEGAVDVDMSTLTGESVPVTRTAGAGDPRAALLAVPDVVFRGTACTGGGARGLVFATGAATEIGRIATLSAGIEPEDSPLEQQIRRVAWLIAAVAVGVGLAFLPLGLLAGLTLAAAATFAIGLLVANVPEGLLPTITLALAVGVRSLAQAGAVVKRLSAVETLGCTSVICTDKTGTLTANRMTVHRVWVPSDGERTVPAPDPAADSLAGSGSLRHLAGSIAACTDEPLSGVGGDPTDLAMARFARTVAPPEEAARDGVHLVAAHPFDPRLRRMSTVQSRAGSSVLEVSVKGAPESLLPLCCGMLRADGSTGPLDGDLASRVVRGLAADGLRVLAVARRDLPGGPGARAEAGDRDRVERDLVLCGVVGLLDPPRPSVAPAVERCHRAGLTVHVITGDNPLTAAVVGRSVGIGRPGGTVVTGAQLEQATDQELERLLARHEDVIFARATPEDKLRIADLLARDGEVVAMTGDGVNDAPALRRADIGVAMGASGTDVAREAATMVLTDDDFATIVRAIESGRQVYDNVRKFILYIFAHAVPEVVPFLLFALSGGAIPLPLTVLQILAIDLGTETLPALALGREPAEPGVMDRPPRRRRESVVSRRMLFRAWGLMGPVSALLALIAFFRVLGRAGWTPGVAVGEGTPLHAAYLQATTSTFAAIVACQIGTALASRTDHVALRGVGLLTNRLLLVGIGFELVFAGAVIYLPAFQRLFGTAALDAATLAMLAVFPVVVWGVDEIYRWAGRRRTRERGSVAAEQTR